MASRVWFLRGIFRASAWMMMVFGAFCFSRFSPLGSMSMLMVSALVFSWENLPASAPTSIIVFSVEVLSAFWMNWVSVLVMYLPMRVLAAFSQCVSSVGVGLLGSANWVSRVVYFSGFTSTFEGKSESFLLHFGQYPLYCWRISSGGLSSSPSYRMWLHPWHLTRWGIDGPFWFVLEI